MNAVGRGTSLALRLVMKTTSLALIVSLVLAHAAPARAESVHVNRAAPVPAAGESGAVRIIRVPHKPGAGSSLEDQRYAMREALSQNAKNFRGGDVIVISATVAVIILLGIIIIILLT